MPTRVERRRPEPAHGHRNQAPDPMDHAENPEASQRSQAAYQYRSEIKHRVIHSGEILPKSVPALQILSIRNTRAPPIQLDTEISAHLIDA